MDQEITETIAEARRLIQESRELRILGELRRSQIAQERKEQREQMPLIFGAPLQRQGREEPPIGDAYPLEPIGEPQPFSDGFKG